MSRQLGAAHEILDPCDDLVAAGTSRGSRPLEVDEPLALLRRRARGRERYEDYETSGTRREEC